ncbi:MAG: DUF1631 family protein [Pseudomonadota bacterium]
MQPNTDPKNLFSAIHMHAVGDLMNLMEGFYSNIEDGLFELAFSSENKLQQQHVVELMRELRFRRKHLLKTFGKRIQASGKCWLGHPADGVESMEERIIAQQMADKSNAHFTHLLQSIAERTSNALNQPVEKHKLPVSPEAISYHFVMSCRSVKIDKYSIEVVQNLFSRFVLDRLGSVYGSVNMQLADAGYNTGQDGLALSSSA